MKNHQHINLEEISQQIVAIDYDTFQDEKRSIPFKRNGLLIIPNTTLKNRRTINFAFELNGLSNHNQYQHLKRLALYQILKRFYVNEI